MKTCLLRRTRCKILMVRCRKSSSQKYAICDLLLAFLPHLSERRRTEPSGCECWRGSLWCVECVISPVVLVLSPMFTKRLTLSLLENMGYINGQVQPEGKYLHTQNITWLWACSSTLAAAFAEAPTPIPSLAYPAVPAHLPAESSFTTNVGLPAEVEDLPDPAGTARIPLDSEPATETPGPPQSHEQPDDDPQQLPRQIHIQQHLKLHFHNQGEFCREQSHDGTFWYSYH